MRRYLPKLFHLLEETFYSVSFLAKMMIVVSWGGDCVGME